MMRSAVTRTLWMGLFLALGCGDDAEDKEQTEVADSSVSATDSGGQPAPGDGGTATGDAAAAPPLLADGKAGAACTNAAACGPAGTCGDKLTFGGIAALLAPIPVTGGYCTADCNSNEQCGASAVCLGRVLGRPGECRATCTQTSDCRAGFECAQSPATASAATRLPATCQPAPVVDKLTADQTGKSCASDAECGDGRCVDPAENTFGAGKYCTGTCVADADCGTGGVCIVGGYGLGGTCREACSQRSDCQGNAAGWGCGMVGGKAACVPKGLPLTAGIVGKACTMASQATDCLSGSCRTQAYGTTYPGGYCVGSCSSDADCGGDGVCISSTTCLLRCNAATPTCRTGYTCKAHPMAMAEQTQTICFPTDSGDAGVAADAGP